MKLLMLFCCFLLNDDFKSSHSPLGAIIQSERKSSVENIKNISKANLQIRNKKPGSDAIDWKPLTDCQLTVSHIGTVWLATGKVGYCDLDFKYNSESSMVEITLAETAQVKHYFSFDIKGICEILTDDKTLYLKWNKNVASITHHNIMSGSYLHLKVDE